MAMNFIMKRHSPHQPPPSAKKHPYPADTSSLVYYNPYGYIDYPAQDNARKRQRRQATGALVMQTLFKQPQQSSHRKKSTAQPRPDIKVLPRSIGPVHDPNPNDVLSGRGGRINAHPGNIHFRELVQSKKAVYLDKATKKLEKAHIAAQIVEHVRNLVPSGRFLKEDSDGAWYEIGDQKAIKKVGQALREDAPDIRKEGSSEDEEEPGKTKSPDKKEEPKPVAAPVQSMSSDKPAPVTVSRRGAKAPSAAIVSDPSSYQPIAYQDVAPPAAYEPIVPPTPLTGGPGNHGAGGFAMPGSRNRAPGVSGAAAAAMQDDNSALTELEFQDIAFGRNFHPHEQDNSLLSGLSDPISGLSDPMSALSMRSAGALQAASMPQNMQHPMQPNTYQALRTSQLQQLRQLWQQQQLPRNSNNNMSDISGATRQLLAQTTASSRSFQPGDDMSLATNSLAGGGIREDSMLGGSALAGGSALSGMSSGSFGIPMPDMGMPPPAPVRGPASARTSSSGTPSSGASTQRMRGSGGAEASVASMSIMSGGDASLLSIPGSIMSDLSENLVALDLEEPRV